MFHFQKPNLTFKQTYVIEQKEHPPPPKLNLPVSTVEGLFLDRETKYKGMTAICLAELGKKSL